MDPRVLESEAESAIAASSSTDELEAVRVRFLGRSAELPQALRQVRDRETGQTLNALRGRLEQAVGARRAELEREELDGLLTADVLDVTLPGDAPPRGHLHLITQIRREVEDVFLGLGYRWSTGVRSRRHATTSTALNFPPGHPARSPQASLYLDDDTRAPYRDVAVADQGDGAAGAARLHRVARAVCYRRDTPDATHTPTFHQVEGLAIDEGITLADLEGTLGTSYAGAVRRWAASRVPHALLPVHGALDRGVRLLPRLRWLRLSRLQALGLDRDRRRRHGRPGPIRVRRLRPGAWTGFAFGWGLERIAVLRHGSPICASSGATTHVSSHSSE